MSSLRRVLLRHREQAKRIGIKPEVNRLVDYRYMGPGLGNVVRAAVQGSRGQSGTPSTVDPDA